MTLWYQVEVEDHGDDVLPLVSLAAQCTIFVSVGMLWIPIIYNSEYTVEYINGSS